MVGNLIVRPVTLVWIRRRVHHAPSPLKPHFSPLNAIVSYVNGT